VKLGVVVVSAAAALSTACASARRSEPIAGPIPLDAKASAGQIVFMRNCQSCHPRGEAGVGPALNNKPLPDAAIRLQIRTGVVGAGTMPPFPPEVLSDEEIDQIIAYLTALRKI
jgi:mono/diheme cytochrome c family protein